MFFIRSVIAAIILQNFIVTSIDCPSKMYKHAETLYRQRMQYAKALKRIYFVRDSDPGSSLFTDSPIDPEIAGTVRKSGQLIDYKEMLRERFCSNDRCCDSKSVKSLNKLWDKYAKCIPEKLRCVPNNVTCNPSDKYRTYDGTCNNLKHWKWGGRNMQYNYMFEPAYDDGINSLRRSVNTNDELVSPRIIGNIFADYCRSWTSLASSVSSVAAPYQLGDVRYTQISQLAIIFAQLIGHDLSGRATIKLGSKSKTGMSCCSKSYDKPLSPRARNPQCIPIPVPADDKIYGHSNIGCMTFVRAQTGLSNDCDMSETPYLNRVTGHLDLSTVYGDSADRSKLMRKFSNGLFDLSFGHALPSGPEGVITGDGRGTQTAWLGMMHSVWYKLHNYLANGLSRVNKNWNDDKLFEEARRLVIAIYQRIIYNEWLPLILGDELVRVKNLTSDYRYYGGRYNPKLDPSTNIEFAHAFCRKFHKYIPDYANFYAESGKLMGSMPFSETVRNTSMIVPDYLESFRGMLYDPISWQCIAYSEEMRSHFEKGKCGHGLDILSMDIIRCRDVGTIPYVKAFDKCVGVTIRRWSDLKPYIVDEYFPLLQAAYSSVHDIDMTIGIISEKKVYGDNGPISACIAGEQFYRSKFGDRFFYTFKDSPCPFTDAQIAEIEYVTIAKVLCWSTKLNSVNTNGFEIPNNINNLVRGCGSFGSFNFEVFKK